MLQVAVLVEGREEAIHVLAQQVVAGGRRAPLLEKGMAFGLRQLADPFEESSLGDFRRPFQSYL